VFGSEIGLARVQTYGVSRGAGMRPLGPLLPRDDLMVGAYDSALSKREPKNEIPKTFEVFFSGSP
jgi:hypothetical protein